MRNSGAVIGGVGRWAGRSGAEGLRVISGSGESADL